MLKLKILVFLLKCFFFWHHLATLASFLCFNLVTSTVDELASLGAASPKVHLVEMEVTDYSSFSSVVDKVILMCFLKEEGGWELDSKDF